MRPRAIFFALIALAAAGYGARELGREGALRVETETRGRVEEALRIAEMPWVRVDADGLRVALSGEAPDEAGRVKAVGIARQLVAEGRIDDAMTVRAADAAPPPAFALELLRTDDEVSMIGLVPDGAPGDEPGGGAASGREAIRAGLRAAGLDGAVSDMLETAARPAPEGWAEALGFGLDALDAAPRSKISIAPGRVSVTAGAESAEAGRALEESLRAARPEGIALDLDISAPRPVIAPFVVDFSFADGAGRFAACAAESEADVVEIGAAAAKLGAGTAPACAIGIGAPVPDWAATVARGIDALGELGGGRFVLRDIEAALTGPEGVAPERLNAVAARLDAALPEVMSLSVEMPPVRAAKGDAPAAPEPRFDARLTPEGMVRLGGAVQNATSQLAIQSYAAARFGADRIEDATVVGAGLPDGWPARVMAGIDGLARLRDGSLRVTAEEVVLRGKGTDAAANAEVKAMLEGKLGDAARVNLAIAPLEVVAPAAIEAGPERAAGSGVAQKPPARCAEEVAAILEAGGIAFEAGSSELEEASQGTIEAMAEALRACPGGAYEVGGHTDAQGSAEGNRVLSEARAEAVAEALRAAGLRGLSLTAKGYGEEQPVADDATEEGRATNRRITFVALGPEPGVEPGAVEPGAADPGVVTIEVPARPGHPVEIGPPPEGDAAPMDALPHDGSGDEIVEDAGGVSADGEDTGGQETGGEGTGDDAR